MKYFVCLILLAFTLGTFGQEALVTHGDSLLARSMEETMKNNIPEALEYAEKAVLWNEKNLGTDSPQYDVAVSNLAFVYFQNKDYDASISLRMDQLQRYELYYGIDSPEYAMILSALATCYSMKKESVKAIEYSKQALSLYEKHKGKSSQEYDMALNTLSMAYVQETEFEKAITLKEEQLKRYRIAYGKETSQYGGVLNELLFYAVQSGNNEKALEYGRDVLDVFEKINDSRFSLAMNMVVSIYSKKKDYDNCIVLQQRDLIYNERVYGKESDNYDWALNNLITTYILKGETSKIISLEEERLAIYGTRYGSESPEYASVLSMLALYYSEVGEHEKAISACKQAIAIYEQQGMKDSKEYADVLYSLGNLMKLAGKHDDAVGIMEDALAIKEKKLDVKDSLFVQKQFEIAAEYARNENYLDAARIMGKTVNVVAEQSGKQSELYILALEALAEYQYRLDDFTDAMNLLKEALEIRGRKPDSKYALTLHNLSNIEYAVGNYFEAIDLEEKALAIWDKQEDEISLNYRKVALTSLSAAYTALGNRYKAGLLTKESMQLDEKQLGIKYPEIAWRDVENDIQGNEELINTSEGQAWLLQFINDGLAEMQTYGMTQTTDYAGTLVSLAFVYMKMGEYAKAIEQMEQVQKIQENVLGKESLDYVTTLQLLAYCKWKQNDKHNARVLLEQALDISKKLLPADHPDNLSLLTGLTVIESQLQLPEAVTHTVEVTGKLKKMILKAFSQLTANERNYYWNEYTQWFENDLPNIAVKYQNTLAGTVYDGLLLSKGLLLNSELEISRLIAESEDENLLNDYYKLRIMRSRIYNLDKEDVSLADSLENVADAIEKKLLEQSKVYGDYTRKLDITWQDVHDKLMPEEVAVEFMTVPILSGQIEYVALVLRKEDTAPVWVTLCNENDLKAISESDLYSDGQASSLLWKPLEQYIQSKKKIYFSPAGLLHNICLEQLIQWKGGRRMADVWSLYRLSSTRQIALNDEKSSLATAVIYGGLAYDANIQTLIEDDKKYPQNKKMNVMLPEKHRSLDFRTGLIEIPGTRTEAIDISKTLSEVHVRTRLYLDADGTEASFKALSGQHIQLLHIGTHGFYWTEKETSNQDQLSFLFQTESNALQYVEDKVLSRSGLLFAGVNHTLRTEELPVGLDDGVLTAREIADLDLRNLDLVVLSACQTGLGEITGEGVFGLQRGFKKAGANSLLMSLWPVDDASTQLLMVQFYKNLVSGKTKYDALCEAQRYVREYKEERVITEQLTPSQKRRMEMQGKKIETKVQIVYPYAKPRYWAGFVLLDGM